MGFKIKSLVSKAIPAVSSAVGAYLGGTSGAGTGYQVGNMISGAVGLGGDGVDSTDKAYARYQMRLQQEMSDYAFNQNLQMWNLNNAYNDPSAQMARLEKAGLNKNLVYGGGNVTGNTSGGTPSYESGSIGMVDKRTQRAQLALAMEEHQQRITNQAIENELARERIGLATREADRQDKLADAQIKAYAANIGLGQERNMLTSQNNQLLADDRNNRIAHMKWKSAHDDWRKQKTLLESSKTWNWLSDREKAKVLRDRGLWREPQLRDFY